MADGVGCSEQGEKREKKKNKGNNRQQQSTAELNQFKINKDSGCGGIANRRRMLEIIRSKKVKKKKKNEK